MKKQVFHRERPMVEGAAAASVLVIDDDRLLLQSVANRLQDAHYTIDTATDADKAFKLLSRYDYNIIILDLILPGKKDGIQFLRELRKQKGKNMVLVISGQSLVEDKVEALRAGADDYLTKPFSFQELLARMEALLRRRGESTSNSLEFQNIVLDLDTRRVSREGKEIKLSSKVFDLLVFLIRNKNRIVTRRELAEQVWGYKFQPESNLIDVYISYLRKDLNKDFSEKILQTVRGVGFLLTDK